MYLTYDEYTSYGGTVSSETTFNQYEFKARKMVDHETFSRVSAMETVPEAVKRCMFELIKLEEIYDDNVLTISGKSSSGSQDAGRLMASFSNDGYTETYATGTGNVGDYLLTLRKSADKAQGALISSYLSGERDDTGTLLLYRGVY